MVLRVLARRSFQGGKQMVDTFKYKRTTLWQWITGFAMLLFLMFFASANPNAYQRQFGIFLSLALLLAYIFLFRKFWRDPSEISIHEGKLILKFRGGGVRNVMYEEIEHIRYGNNPVFDHVKGRLDIRIRGTGERFRISGNIGGFDQIVALLDERGFDLPVKGGSVTP